MDMILCNYSPPTKTSTIISIKGIAIALDIPSRPHGRGISYIYCMPYARYTDTHSQHALRPAEQGLVELTIVYTVVLHSKLVFFFQGNYRVPHPYVPDLAPISLTLYFIVAIVPKPASLAARHRHGHGCLTHRSLAFFHSLPVPTSCTRQRQGA
jgi:hypothetical protein